MNFVTEVEDRRAEVSQASMPESLEVLQSSPEEHPRERSSIGVVRSAMTISRFVLEVAMWATYSSPIMIHGGAWVMSVALHKGGVLFVRDCLGYWYFLCHYTTDGNENPMTFIQWREQAEVEAISWKSLLVEGPAKLGHRLYPALVEFGQEILVPRGLQFFWLMAELSMLVFRCLVGTIITLSPWALKILWPDRRCSSARKASGFVIDAVEGHPCELDHSTGYHIDITHNSQDGSTIVSEITHDEASIPSMDGKAHYFKKAPLLQRLPMEAIRSKWKKTTGFRSSGLPISRKLRQSVLKQKVV